MGEPAKDLAQQLLARLEAQRETWVELDEPPRRAVCLLRPRETEMHALRDGVGVDLVCRFATGWRGFTERDVLGADGSDFAVAWAPAVFDAWVRDDALAAAKLAQGLADAARAYLDRKAATQGN